MSDLTADQVAEAMHFQGPAGFEPCTREWPHDGPCAHRELPIPKFLRKGSQVYDIGDVVRRPLTVVARKPHLAARQRATIFSLSTGKSKRMSPPPWEQRQVTVKVNATGDQFDIPVWRLRRL